MNLELTEQQRQTLERLNEPIRVRDPKSNHESVVMRTEDFERVRRLLAAELVDPSLYEFE